jgi:hypothetical protein
MNGIRTPGFSAESSLSPISTVVRARLLRGGPGDGRDDVVRPAMRAPVDWFCEHAFCCLVGDGWHVCYERASRPTR